VNILHVSPTFYPATRFGGPIVSLRALCDALTLEGDLTLRVLTTDAGGFASADRLTADAIAAAKRELRFPVDYRKKSFGAEFSRSMLAAIPRAVRNADLVHISYAYSWSTLAALRACARYGVPAVWTPRGALQGWSERERKTLKRAWDAIAIRWCRNGNVTLHFTSPAEQTQSAPALPGVPSVVIPNGVEIPENPIHISVPQGGLRLLYLGRLHPIKALERLLAAMALLDPDVTLSLHGDGDPAYRAALETQCRRDGLEERVRFHGHADDAAKEAAFRTADILVLASHSENFGMAAAEALARGIPVIASTGTPWQQLEERGCGRCVPNTPEALAEAVRSLRREDLPAMGERGHAWMREEFSVATIATSMHRLYRSLVGGAA
jgi:glycosyltransferase involved in cell wall biosynthesis